MVENNPQVRENDFNQKKLARIWGFYGGYLLMYGLKDNIYLFMWAEYLLQLSRNSTKADTALFR